jgi:hypothetical protein
MTIDRAQTVNVDLPLSFVHALLTMRHLMSDDLMAALERAHKPVIVAPAPRLPEKVADKAKRAAPVSSGSPHKAMILGKVIGGKNWSDLFANCVDAMHDISPEALEVLALEKTHARRIIARDRNAIHIKAEHLRGDTRQTRSGWWVDKNVGEPMFLRSIKKMADAAQLQFGKDIIFPIPADQK